MSKTYSLTVPAAAREAIRVTRFACARRFPVLGVFGELDEVISLKLKSKPFMFPLHNLQEAARPWVCTFWIAGWRFRVAGYSVEDSFGCQHNVVRVMAKPAGQWHPTGWPRGVNGEFVEREIEGYMWPVYVSAYGLRCDRDLIGYRDALTGRFTAEETVSDPRRVL